MKLEDFTFFHSLKGKTIRCNKDFIWNKNSMKGVFAFKSETFTIDDIRDIYVETKGGGIRSINESEITIDTEIQDIVFSITRSKDSAIADIDYLPNIKSKRQFKIYFTEHETSGKIRY